MQIERTEQGWVVRVPDTVAQALGVSDGTRVTLRPVPRQTDDIRHAFSVMRGRMPDFPFDDENWDGVDVTPSFEPAYRVDFEWSTKPAGRLPLSEADQPPR